MSSCAVHEYEEKLWMYNRPTLDEIVLFQIQLQDRIFDSGKHKPYVLRVCHTTLVRVSMS